jgi:hypothetical protein
MFPLTEAAGPGQDESKGDLTSPLDPSFPLLVGQMIGPGVALGTCEHILSLLTDKKESPLRYDNNQQEELYGNCLWSQVLSDTVGYKNILS